MACDPLNLHSLSSMFENLSSLLLQFSELNDSTIAIPEDALQGLPSLKKLTVVSARKHRLPEKWSRGLNSLTGLLISNCNIRICLSEGWLWHLTSLVELRTYNCPELVEFAEEFKHLHSLNASHFDMLMTWCPCHKAYNNSPHSNIFYYKDFPY
ncbi:hypothetical protein ACS0TY_016349 [Phlomoides rotata]